MQTGGITNWPGVKRVTEITNAFAVTLMILAFSQDCTSLTGIRYGMTCTLMLMIMAIMDHIMTNTTVMIMGIRQCITPLTIITLQRNFREIIPS